MSRRSDTSSLVKRKRAKAEALKASVTFAEKQAALLKQEAQMEATLPSSSRIRASVCATAATLRLSSNFKSAVISAFLSSISAFLRAAVASI
jgi:hypothetical protein